MAVDTKRMDEASIWWARECPATADLRPLLEQYGACRAARTWAAGRAVAEDSWLACERGDWLLWIAARLGVDRRLVVLAACDCARLALGYIPEGEHRPRLAIEAAERWAKGEATIEEMRAAASAAYAAADAAYDAAYDAVYAATAAATYATYASAADAASALALLAAAPAADKTAALRTCADLVRARIPWAVVAERIQS